MTKKIILSLFTIVLFLLASCTTSHVQSNAQQPTVHIGNPSTSSTVAVGLNKKATMHYIAMMATNVERTDAVGKFKPKANYDYLIVKLKIFNESKGNPLSVNPKLFTIQNGTPNVMIEPENLAVKNMNLMKVAFLKPGESLEGTLIYQIPKSLNKDILISYIISRTGYTTQIYVKLY